MVPADADCDDRGFLTPERVRGLFDRAVEHFNAARFFESHEDWETVWLEAEGRHRLWLQGLIQFAAALHHVDHGTASGLVKLVRSAQEKLSGYGGETHGLDVARLTADVAIWSAFAAVVAAGAPKRGPQTPAFPRLAYVAGHEPLPLPPESDGDDHAAS